jgi:hypothetical protein
MELAEQLHEDLQCDVILTSEQGTPLLQEDDSFKDTINRLLRKRVLNRKFVMNVPELVANKIQTIRLPRLA